MRWPWQKKRAVPANRIAHYPKRIDIGKTVRVENGPRRRMAVATKQLLSDAVTAPHYQENLRDAFGAVIKLGQHMTYLDYYGEWVWYVYKWDGSRWIGRGFEPTQEAALQLAWAIAKES